MATNIKESEIEEFLRSIEIGEVKLTPLKEPQGVYAGNVSYSASNGWVITIFNDANGWDYIDNLRTPDGREADYDDIFHHMPKIESYQPSAEVSWERYGIPGEMMFRCTKCGKSLARSQRKQPFVCVDCTSVQ